MDPKLRISFPKTAFKKWRWVVVLAAILAVSATAYGQSTVWPVWENQFTQLSFGFDILWDEGNYVVTGTKVISSTSPPPYGAADIGLMKISGVSDSVSWSKTYPQQSIGYSLGRSVRKTSDGGYIILGRTGGGQIWPSAGGAVLIKTDSLGNFQKAQFYGQTTDMIWPSEVQFTPDGNYICVGTKIVGGSEKVWLLKAKAADLSVLWEKTFSGNDEFGASIQGTGTGYVICGTKLMAPTDRDLMLIQTDLNGIQVGATINYGGDYHDWAHKMLRTPDGGYIIAGTTFSMGPGTPSKSNVWLVKRKADLSKDWAVGIDNGNLMPDEGFSVALSGDGGYMIAGATTNHPDGNPGSVDFWLVKTDQYGNKKWDKPFGGPYTDKGYSVCSALGSSNPDDWGTVYGAIGVYGDTPTPPKAYRITVTPLPNPSTNWLSAYSALASPADIEVLKTYRDNYLINTSTGSIFVKTLYANSEAALDVLLTNPDLMYEARTLIQANIGAVENVLAGQEAVVSDTDKILTFLEDFASKSSSELASLATSMKNEIARRKKKKQKFLGFTLK